MGSDSDMIHMGADLCTFLLTHMQNMMENDQYDRRRSQGAAGTVQKVLQHSKIYDIFTLKCLPAGIIYNVGQAQYYTMFDLVNMSLHLLLTSLSSWELPYLFSEVCRQLCLNMFVHTPLILV